MPKIRRHGGLTVHSSGRAFVSPADELRARGKLGPYGVTVEGVEVESETAGTGEAVNAETGEVTQPGESLPSIPQTDGEPLEESWPGNSSETSPAKPQKSDEPERASRPKRARTTGSRSRRGQGESSSASSTATSGPGTDA